MSSQVHVAKKVLGARLHAANEVGGFGSGDRTKCVKLKTEKLESQKLAKSQKSSKSKSEILKKLLKSRNSLNFYATKAGQSFLTPDARTTFNCLRLAFTKAPIYWHFDLEYHI